MYLDSGIDTGDIAAQARIKGDKTQQEFYPTPKTFQLFKLFFLTISKQILCITSR